jgi:hypothetical protein
MPLAVIGLAETVANSTFDMIAARCVDPVRDARTLSAGPDTIRPSSKGLWTNRSLGMGDAPHHKIGHVYDRRR